ncbi:hypothetical protein HOU03_gp162 [Caulobacter phage CcrSC]|uniref:DUF8033 domain-containing protein n=1 Tax=Caulobacter phage CcrSC TaxID=2283272 RepID=A0A385ED43_9CAUD|nr:hypothetical protein HOU03_gp024 [Caulobacter phage CcrSC]YP_009810736.1 hypothetical protein HOU03_gp162 [Caulobacter phage CcrSC]AXQ69606.1 hypothetical protein CcrSC_gp024 [Caulobacter phage CcrSC]AXQ70106.1 hypothetical protein CcrSC_gp524 [Caulobacter phage CcrSC]
MLNIEDQTIRLREEGKNKTTTVIGGVLLFFSYSTLVGFRCPRLGMVINPAAKSYGVTTARHVGEFGLGAPGVGKTATEEDFQRLAMGAVMGSSGPDYLLLN